MRKLFAMMMAVVLAVGLTACGSAKPKTADVKPDAVVAKIKAALGEGYLCDEDMDADTFYTYYGLDKDKVTAYVAQDNSIGAVHPDVVIAMTVAEGYEQTAIDGINAAYSGVVGYARLYNFSLAKVLQARLYRSGTTIVYVLAGAETAEGATDDDAAKLATAEYAKVDAAVKELFGSLPENLAVVPAA